MSAGAGTAKSRWSLRSSLPIVLYGAVGAIFIAVGVHQHGVVRFVALAAGLVGVGIATMAVLSVLLFLLGWGSIAATFRAHPSVVQRIAWWSAAAAIGTLLGSSAYAVGVAGLSAGHLVFAAVIFSSQAARFHGPWVNRRLVAFAAVAAVVAVVVGATIFV